MSEPQLYQIPSVCSVCGGACHVERVRCEGCGSAIEGRFTAGWVSRLSAPQAEFARVFLECRGKIKDVEQALGISYPTVVSRLDEVVQAMTGRPASSRAERRLQILDSLAEGKIDAEEAARLLRESA